MFGIDSSELLFIALVALLVIGPKDLPRAMRWVGQWVGKGRAMSRHLRTGFDAMMREAEMEEMQKIWAAQNEAIMKATALPQEALPDLSGPVSTDTAAEPWPPAPAELPPPAAEAPAKKPRKPRAKKAPAPAADPAPQGEEA
ncbi:Sec-independent protein translocase protein TatB [Sandarakinorhabdus oryzae]|uniref:Sec-independent protein translocase protein TatB n=1 Tax=Sandarakinorhabdus oryzae TaxID=2675220 RepID=UPI0012E30356|nr:Sec-independent protein translocase protein TatB [Sandarakinorhabdus oryzae]